jgi:ABC-type lipoprotein export system ATPase subunit
VSVAGVEIAALDDTELTKLRRDHIGFIFQFFNLLPMLTAAENIALPLKLAGAAYILDGTDGMPFEAAEGDALARVPGVTAASHVRVDKALVAGREQDVTGVDPATIARF